METVYRNMKRKRCNHYLNKKPEKNKRNKKTLLKYESNYYNLSLSWACDTLRFRVKLKTLTVVEFINSNRKFNVSPDGTLLSHTTNPFTFHCGNLMSQSTERQKISTSGFHFWRPGRQRSRCLRSLLHFGWITPGGRWIAGWDVDGGGGGGWRGTC